MRRFVIAVLALLVVAAPAAANEVDTVGDWWGNSQGKFVPGPVYQWGRDVLHDNGPVYNAPGLSILESTTLGMSTLGFGHQFGLGYRMADDFTVDAGLWNIVRITFFAYQTGAATSPSTMTGVYFQIWDGSPDDAGSSVVWGDLVTNRLSTSVWSEIYRVAEGDQGATNRPIMANTCNVLISLPAGDYWLDWMTDGSLTSGPWAPPIVVLGQTTTGNGLQYTTAWADAVDSGTATPQGLPFIIEGCIPTPVEQASWSSIKALYR